MTRRVYLPPIDLPKESRRVLSQSLDPATNLKELGELFINMQSANPDCGKLCGSNGPDSSTDKRKQMAGKHPD